MLQKREIETMLNINGVSLTAPDSEIRAVFERARYTDSEINVMFMMLRGTAPVLPGEFEDLEKAMRMDKGLKPGQVSALLGIQMDVDVDEFGFRKSSKPKLSIMQMVLIGVLAMTLVGGGLYAAMYYTKIGPFHPTSAHILP